LRLNQFEQLLALRDGIALCIQQSQFDAEPASSFLCSGFLFFQVAVVTRESDYNL
jgi:hypothetical protein